MNSPVAGRRLARPGLLRPGHYQPPLADVTTWPASYAPLESRFTVVPLETGPEQMLVIFNAHLSYGANDAGRQREADSFAAFIRDAQSDAMICIVSWTQ